MSFLILLICCCLTAFNGAFSAIIYVSSTYGNDSTTCGSSAAQACQSLAEAFLRVLDNDTVQLSGGELFPVADTLNVTVRNLTLRADAGARAVVSSDGSVLPMLLFESIESFVLENVDFLGAGVGFNSTALMFNAAPMFSDLRLENASFANFNVETNSIWNLVAIVQFKMPSTNFSAPSIAGPPETRCVLRHLSFRNNSASVGVPVPSVDVGENRKRGAVAPMQTPGSQVCLHFNENLQTTLDVRIEHVDVQNCSCTAISGSIAIQYDQHVSSLLFDHVRIANVTTFAAGGVWLVRLARTPDLSRNVTHITVKNCEFTGIRLPKSGIGVFSGQLDGDVQFTMTNSSFVDNVAGHDYANDYAFSSGLYLSVGTFVATAGMQKSTVNVSVADCNFRNNGRPKSLAVGGAIVLEYGSNCNNATATIVRSKFRDNSLCAACAAGPYFGGAIQVRSDAYLASLCNAVRTESLLIDSCDFVNNVAARGGAIGTRNSCRGVTIQTIIRNSHFFNNSALAGQLGSGGAVVYEVDESAIVQFESIDDVEISHCNFFDNNATASGGAVALSRGVNVPFSTVALTVANVTMFGNVAPLGEQLWVALARSVNVTFSQIMSIADTEAILVLNWVKPFDDSSTTAARSVIADSLVRCGPGFLLTIENVSITLSDLGNSMTQLQFLCRPCSPTTYNLFGEFAIFDNNSQVAPSTFRCHGCPIGARHNCSGSAVGTSRGFWAMRPSLKDENTTIQFQHCPAHFCCDDPEGCADPHTCSHNRTGALCGGCQRNFTHAFAMRGACVPLEVCSATNVRIGNSLVLIGCVVFVVYSLFLRKSATSDGLVKIIVSFCNIAQVVIGNSIALTPTNVNSGGAFSNGLRALFSMISGLIQPQLGSLTYCPMEEMSSFEKLVAPLGVPAALLAVWAIMSIAHVVYGRLKHRRRVVKRRSLVAPVNAAMAWDDLSSRDAAEDDADDTVALRVRDATRQLPVYRVFASLLTVLDFSLFIIVGVCVSLLNMVTITIPLPSHSLECRLWLAGDTKCSTGVTVGASVLMSVVLLAPFCFELWRRVRPQSILGVAIADVYQSAMAPHARNYNFAITARRVFVAFVNAFIVDNELRVVLLRTVILQACILHAYVGGPFASRWVNRGEVLALFAIIMVMLMQSTGAGAGNDELHNVFSVIQIVMLTVTLVVLVGGFLFKVSQPCWRRSNAVRRDASSGIVMSSNQENEIVKLQL